MKKLLIIISLVLCLGLLFTGCEGSSKPTNKDNSDKTEASSKDNDEEEASEEEEEKEKEASASEATNENSEEISDSGSDASEGKAELGSGDFETIGDISEYWSKLYESCEEAVNKYEGMETLALVTPGLCFVTGVQYDLLNLMNENGHFEGDLMFAGYKGFVDKNGSQLTFGYEDVLEEDGFTPDMVKGDKLIESGSSDLEKGYYYSDNYTEREGKRIKRSTNEFMRYKDGSMSTIIMDGSTLNWRGEEEMTTNCTFLHIANGSLEYVVANMGIGPEFEVIKLEDGMSKEKVIELFEAAGGVIEHGGSVKDGVFALDK